MEALEVKKGLRFLVRQVEAWADPDDGWTYNNTWAIGEMVTCAQDVRAALTAWLKRRGIIFKKNRTRIEFDGDNYTIVDRKTGEPLFDAVCLDW